MPRHGILCDDAGSVGLARRDTLLPDFLLDRVGLDPSGGSGGTFPQLSRGGKPIPPQVAGTLSRAGGESPAGDRFNAVDDGECLDFLIPFNAGHLNSVLESRVQHFSHCRPHMGLGPAVPAPARPPPESSDRHQFPPGFRVRSTGILAGFPTSTGSRKKRHSGGSAYCGALKQHGRSVGVAGGSLRIGGSRTKLYAALNRNCGCPTSRMQNGITESWLAAILRLRRVR